MQRIDITSADAGKSRTKPKLIACALVTADDPFWVNDGQAMYFSWKIQQQVYSLKPIADQ